MKKYFLSANTSSGYISFYDETMKNLEKSYILSDLSEAEASTVIFNISDIYGADEIILNPMNTNLADGCILSKKKLGIFSKRTKIFPEQTDDLSGLYTAYGEAKKIHDEWEKIYIENMDTVRLNSYQDKIIYEILKDLHGCGKTENINRFFGASTPFKPVNFINELTEDLESRYFIKGRPGTGKSTFLKRFRNEAIKRGFDTETYFCSFDPKSLDMVVVRELSVCIFDSTAPHEMFPESKRDCILDFYTEAGLEGIDEKYDDELKKKATDYKEKVNEGLGYLKKIYENMNITENIEKEKTATEELKTLLDE